MTWVPARRLRDRHSHRRVAVSISEGRGGTRAGLHLHWSTQDSAAHCAFVVHPQSAIARDEGQGFIAAAGEMLTDL